MDIDDKRFPLFACYFFPLIFFFSSSTFFFLFFLLNIRGGANRNGWPLQISSLQLGVIGSQTADRVSSNGFHEISPVALLILWTSSPPSLTVENGHAHT